MKKILLILMFGILLVGTITAGVIGTITYDGKERQKVNSDSILSEFEEIQTERYFTIGSTGYVMKINIPSKNYSYVGQFDASSEPNQWELIMAFQELNNKVKVLEQLLNVTYVEPLEDSLPLYSCVVENSVKECPLGISGGKHTRCYLSEILTVKTWDYCSSGWSQI